MHNKFKIPIPSGAPRKALALLLSVAMLIPMASAIIVALDVAVAPAPALAAAPETTLADGSPLPYYVVKYPNPEAVPQDVRDRWAAQGGGINDEGYLVVPGCNNPGWSDTRPALNATAPNAAAIATNLAKNLCVSRTSSVMPCEFCVDCQKKLYEDMYTTFSTFTYAGLLGLGAINVPNTLRDSINTSVSSGNFDGPAFTPFIYNYVAPDMVADIAIPLLESKITDAIAGAGLPAFINEADFTERFINELMADLFDEVFIGTVFKGPQSWPYTDPLLLQEAPFGGILSSIKTDTDFINYLKQEAIVAMTKTQADIIWNNGNPTRGEGSVATVNMQGSNVNIVRGHWNNTTGMLTGSGATLSVLADRVQPRRWSRVGMVYDPLLQLTETGAIIQDPDNIYSFEERQATMDKVMKMSDIDLDDVFARLDMNKLISNIQADYDNIIVPAVTAAIDSYWEHQTLIANNPDLRAALVSYINELAGADILLPGASWDDIETVLAQAKKLSYTIDYYLDDAFEETETVTKEVWYYANQLAVDNLDPDRYFGYKLYYTDPVDLPAMIGGGGVIEAYYYTDDGQVKDVGYGIEYYFGNILLETITVTKEVQILVTQLAVEPVDVAADRYTGLKFDHIDPAELPDMIADGGVIKVYYVRDASFIPADEYPDYVVQHPTGTGLRPGGYLLDGYYFCADCPGPHPVGQCHCAPATGNAQPRQYCVDCQVKLFEELKDVVDGFSMSIIMGSLSGLIKGGSFDDMIKDSIKDMVEFDALMDMVTPMLAEMIEAMAVGYGLPEGLGVGSVVEYVMQSEQVRDLIQMLYDTDYVQEVIDKVVEDIVDMVLADPVIMDAILDLVGDAIIDHLAREYWKDGNPTTTLLIGHWSPAANSRSWNSFGINTTVIVNGGLNAILGNFDYFLETSGLDITPIMDMIDMTEVLNIVMVDAQDIAAKYWVDRWEPAIMAVVQEYIDLYTLDLFDGWSIIATKEDSYLASYILELDNSGDWLNIIIDLVLDAGFEISSQTDENGDKVNYFDIVTTSGGGGGLLPSDVTRLIERGRAPEGIYTVEVAYSGYFDFSGYGFATPVRLTLARETVVIEIKDRDPAGEGIFDKAIAQMLAGPSTEYHPIIADEFVEVSALIAYDWVALMAELARGGFTDFEYFDYETDMMADIEQNRTPHAFAKKVVDGKTIVVVIIRGTGTEYDGLGSLGRWVSNLNMNTTTGYHDGFYGAMLRVLENLDNYLKKHSLNLKDGNTKLLITGHSRGGAVGNLLAGYIQSNGLGSKENIFGYNFAATDIAIVDPVTKSSWESPTGAYNNIFNINNEWDLFAYFPGILTNLLGDDSEWAKYGRTLWFNDASNNATLLGAHRPELYIRYIQAHPSLLQTYNSGTVSQLDILGALLGGEDVYNEFNGPTYTSSQTALIRLIFDPAAYAKANPLAAKQVGLSTNALLNHFLDNSHSNPALLNAFSHVYNSDYYIANNSAIAAVFKNDPIMMFKYFLTVGMSMGDHSIDGWNVEDYMAANPDLVELYGNDLKMYYIHYNLYGDHTS